ncbi:glycoside hydrolase family 43 protein [Zunongwangia endophytica]|uniref:Glycoside hydrolase family 43 protein n=1 Tax=Zunongwangia endophytica TaxID=1808945 RepID=A0ABV8HFK4_9FLAO|nr:glycoside hydrolase family 43 protein [Zunongwangia endophytica]MDN3596727.1 glycoside hydrolase family 43 protein [Zunongwangia endophytica]
MIRNKITVFALFAIIMSLLSCKQTSEKSDKNAAESKAEKEKMAAYLMVYFKDDDHSLHMALSNDGESFTDINKGKAVIAGDTIAEQQGIRDPHIYRGEDGNFYLAMTDLHIFAKRDGLRETEWQRAGEKYGWGNNRGFVLMKSNDLINWQKTNVRIDKSFPGYEEVGAAWAPETTFDKKEGKLMLYYTMRMGNERNQMYYSYVNDNFDSLVSEPKLIFDYPKDVSYIDADITQIGNKFHMFYTPHDGTPGIKQAVSSEINQGYEYQEEWIDKEAEASEAPNVWKIIGEDKWILMYDIYGIQPHNFGFLETTDFKNFKDLGHFNEGVMKATNFSSPKHGAVIHLTKSEAENLAAYWNFDFEA